MLSQLLYNQPDLRPPVLRAMKIVVESNAKPTEVSKTDGESSHIGIFLSEEEVAKNAAFLQSQSESWFAVLFNVFGSVGRDQQGMVGDVINTWASIADEKVKY